MRNKHEDRRPIRDKNEKDPQDDHLDEVEKLLAGKDGVNMPAILTRDSKGG